MAKIRRLALCILLAGCAPPQAPPHGPAVSVAEKPEPLTAAVEAEIRQFCGDCHALPRPETFPRDAWPQEIERGFGLYFESGRSDLRVPRILDVVRFYTERAPKELSIPLPPEADAAISLKWRAANGPEGDRSLLPATANVCFRPARDGQPAVLLTSDMRSGEVYESQRVAGGGWSGTVLARLANPAHLDPCDLDQDGREDLLVAELGSLDPADHQAGRVTWLRRDEEGRGYQVRVLADRLGRVADVRAADFDRDGDLDLVVAEFGWHRTGRILLLEHPGGRDPSGPFGVRVLYSYPGTIHVPPCDLNGDGWIDFIALVSQHQETVLAFLNQGDGTFSPQVLWSAEDPSFGSSGIELVDLDDDGDLDVLGTSGDTFDNKHVKPYHGVYWLENEGRFPFRHTLLTPLPGAYRAVAGDVDGDGDRDIVASAFLPFEPLTALDVERQQSLVLLERTDKKEFRRHGIEWGRMDHATLTLDDLDGDGDLDLAVGEFPRDGELPHPRFRVWWNEGAVTRAAETRTK
ncbi:MAG: VCBS repeat-containing protein [Pirellulales bacterium]